MTKDDSSAVRVRDPEKAATLRPSGVDDRHGTFDDEASLRLLGRPQTSLADALKQALVA